jgi:hypothetical protein
MKLFGIGVISCFMRIQMAWTRRVSSFQSSLFYWWRRYFLLLSGIVLTPWCLCSVFITFEMYSYMYMLTARWCASRFVWCFIYACVPMLACPNSFCLVFFLTHMAGNELPHCLSELPIQDSDLEQYLYVSNHSPFQHTLWCSLVK